MDRLGLQQAPSRTKVKMISAPLGQFTGSLCRAYGSVGGAGAGGEGGHSRPLADMRVTGREGPTMDRFPFSRTSRCRPSHSHAPSACVAIGDTGTLLDTPLFFQPRRATQLLSTPSSAGRGGNPPRACAVRAAAPPPPRERRGERSPALSALCPRAVNTPRRAAPLRAADQVGHQLPGCATDTGSQPGGITTHRKSKSAEQIIFAMREFRHSKQGCK